MLEHLFSTLEQKKVTPVTPVKIEVLPLEAADYKAVTLVTPVTPQKTISESESKKHDRDPFDDRRHCHECSHLSQKRCLAQKFKPVDDVVRRCADFAERV